MRANRKAPPHIRPARAPALAGAMVCLAALYMALGALAPSAKAQEPEKEGGDSPYSPGELEMVEKINDYREDNGLSRLEVSDTASTAAAHHSEDMARYDFFSHDTQESDYYEAGADLADRMDEAGYDHDTYRSENIAAGHEDVEATLEQWKNSPDHNDNMLSPDLEVIGIGKFYSEDSSYGCYWTTDFGSYTPDQARTVEEIRGSGEDPEANEDSSSPTAQSQDEQSSDPQSSDPQPSNASSDQYEVAGGAGDSSSQSSGETGNNDRQVTQRQEEQSPAVDQYASGADGEDNSFANETDREADNGTQAGMDEGKDEGKDEGMDERSGASECESATESLEASPFEEDFGEKLQDAIDEEVSCKMEKTGVQSAEPGEDEADSSGEAGKDGESTSIQESVQETSTNSTLQENTSQTDGGSPQDDSGNSSNETFIEEKEQ